MDISNFYYSQLEAPPRNNTINPTPIQNLLSISQAQIDDTLLNLSQNKFRFEQKPLNSDSKTYFTTRQAIQFESELIQTLTSVLNHLKKAIFTPETPETLNEILARNQTILLQNFWNAAIFITINNCKQAILTVEKSRPAPLQIAQKTAQLDDFWLEEEQQLTSKSEFQANVNEYLQAREIQQNVQEIAKIQDIFAENLQNQGEQILRIQDVNLKSEENLELANKFLARAKRNLEDSTKVVVVLLGLAIAGLWYIDAVRK